MTTNRTSATVTAALVCVAALLTAGVPALAQRGSVPGMSGCPDGTKDGVLAAQPTPGGGCDDAVYKGDEPRGGMRGIKPAAPRPDRSESDSKPSTKKKSAKDKHE